MNDTVVGDQSRWEELRWSELLPSTAARQYNGASVTLWLRLGCTRYSWAVSSASLLFIHPAHFFSHMQKKKKKKVNTHLFLASLPLPCLINRQRECMPVFSVRAGQQMFIYCCFLECASLWFGFSSSVIGLKDRVMAVGAPDNLLTRSTRAERRVFVLSSLAAGELLSNIQGLRDTAAVCLLLIACTHACTLPQTWQGGGKAASQLLSYASILFLRGVLNISSFEYAHLHQWDNSEQKPKKLVFVGR